MSDLFLNDDFEVELDDRGDLKTVSGEERVVQSVAVHIANATWTSVGEVHYIEEHLTNSIKNVLETHSLLEDVKFINVEKDEEQEGRYEITVSLESQSLTFGVNTE